MNTQSVLAMLAACLLIVLATLLGQSAAEAKMDGGETNAAVATLSCMAQLSQSGCSSCCNKHELGHKFNGALFSVIPCQCQARQARQAAKPAPSKPE